jgi:hypothetical protein
MHNLGEPLCEHHKMSPLALGSSNGDFAHPTASHIEYTLKPKVTDVDAAAVLALRNFIFDICNQNGGGHGGSAIGMAAIGVALYKYVMRYNPFDPEWFDRDRFVLSNGRSNFYCRE